MPNFYHHQLLFIELIAPQKFIDEDEHNTKTHTYSKKNQSSIDRERGWTNKENKNQIYRLGKSL